MERLKTEFTSPQPSPTLGEGVAQNTTHKLLLTREKGFGFFVSFDGGVDCI